MVRGRKNPLHFGLGKRLAAVRKEQKIGGKPLSLAAGLSMTAVLRIEQDSSIPSVETVAKLAAVLKVSPSHLAYGIAPRSIPSTWEQESALPQRLRQLREERDLSLNALAKLSGVARTTIGYIEAKETAPSIATIELLAQALGVSVCWLAFAEQLEGEEVARPTATESAHSSSQS